MGKKKRFAQSSVRERLVASGGIRPASAVPGKSESANIGKSPVAADPNDQAGNFSHSVPEQARTVAIERDVTPAISAGMQASSTEVRITHPFADLDALQAELLAKPPTEFISKYFFEAVPYIFDGDVDQWISWKTEIATAIGVDPKEIVLTGSAAIGFSLNPQKNFRRYTPLSDIDVCVISQFHFETAWRHLRQNRAKWLDQAKAVRLAIASHRTNYIYEGSVATDRLLHILPFGETWQTALDSASTREPTIERSIKIRIYRDFDSLRYYKSENIRNIAAKILSDRSTEEEPIPEEK